MSEAIDRFVELDQQLAAWRANHPEGSPEEDAILDEMDVLWQRMSETETFAYELLNIETVAETKISEKVTLLWQGAGERNQVESALHGRGKQLTSLPGRLGLAVLKLSGGNLEHLIQLVSEAHQDPEALMDRAERPATSEAQQGGERDEHVLEALRAQDRLQYLNWLWK
jgi:hypothetical protein